MPQKRTSSPSHASYVDELYALFVAGGYWGLAPDWVPRSGYAAPTRAVLRRVEAGLLGGLAPRTGEER